MLRSFAIIGTVFLVGCVAKPSADPVVVREEHSPEFLKVREQETMHIKGQDNQLVRPVMVSVEDMDSLHRLETLLRQDTSVWLNGEVKEENIQALLGIARNFKQGFRNAPPNGGHVKVIVGYVFVYLPSGPNPKGCMSFGCEQGLWDQIVEGKLFVQTKYKGSWVFPVKTAQAEQLG